MSVEITKKRAELRALHEDAVRAKAEASKAHGEWREVQPRDGKPPSPMARVRHARWQAAQKRYDDLRALIAAEQEALRALIAATPEEPMRHAQLAVAP